MKQISVPAQLKFKREIEERTLYKMRSYLDEIANDTSDYRSIKNLTREVTHQYKGRFLIELLQNAHDALKERPAHKSDGRIHLVLSRAPGLSGVLYVANDGTHFTESNFKKICQFGQSDKDPQKNIGNKGIGFRSVLEISECPEIYSRSELGSPGLDGYCFRFEPNVTRHFETAIRELFGTSMVPHPPFDPDVDLVDWTEKKREQFRKRLHEGEPLGITELEFLSPYLFPLYADLPLEDKVLARLALEGFATVVRLPLKSAEAYESACKAMGDIDHTSTLFLQRVRFLICETEDGIVEWERSEKAVHDASKGIKVKITKSLGKDRPETWNYLIWEKVIGGSDDPAGKEKIKRVTTELGGRWTEMEEATVSIAVCTEKKTEDGKIYIFLPTEVKSGTGAHINAPFYGNIARTEVRFINNKYNELLLKEAASLASGVIKKSLAGKGETEARAIVDLMAPVSIDSLQGINWLNLVDDHLKINSSDSKLGFADGGKWRPFSALRLPKDEWDSHRLLTGNYIRRHSAFEMFGFGIRSRYKRIDYLLNAIGIADPYPNPAELKSTLARVAKELSKLKKKAEWNAFWLDARRMFPYDSSVLQEHKILVGDDWKLHSAGEEKTVFFLPGNAPLDEDELDGEAIRRLPERVSARIAFLNSCIKLVEQKGSRRESNEVHRYLSNGLVDRFKTQDVLRAVGREFQNLPLPLDAQGLGEVTQWGLNLITAQRSRRPKSEIPDPIQQLPVPCVAGWFPLKEASFGPGWSNSCGEELLSWLSATNCQSSLGKLMLAPNDRRWGFDPLPFREILQEAGVFSGLRLIETTPGEWESMLYGVAGYRFLRSARRASMRDSGPNTGNPARIISD
jgi:hypothetical protein